MDTWLLIVLIAIGALMVLSIVLFAMGKGDVVKKVILPLIGILGAGAAAGKVLGQGSKDIRSENERIKSDLKDVEDQRDALRETTTQVKEAHEEKVKDLEDRIAESDEQADGVRAEVKETKEKGPKEWYDSLTEAEKKEMQAKYESSDVPDKYKNPS